MFQYAGFLLWVIDVPAYHRCLVLKVVSAPLRPLAATHLQHEFENMKMRLGPCKKSALLPAFALCLLSVTACSALTPMQSISFSVGHRINAISKAKKRSKSHKCNCKRKKRLVYCKKRKVSPLPSPEIWRSKMTPSIPYGKFRKDPLTGHRRTEC